MCLHLPEKYLTEVHFPSQHNVAGVECGLSLCGAPAGGDAVVVCSPGESEVAGAAAAEAPGAAPEDRLCLPMSIVAAA